MRKDSINFSSPLCDDVAIRLFEHIPGNNILVYADPPNYTVAAVSADYLEIAVKNKSDLVGKGIFDSFPSNRNNPDDNGESKLRASFQEVIEHKRKAISTHRYDILNLKGEFEEKYWKVFNIPFNDENGDIKFIIHNVEDITYEIKWKQQENFIKEVQVRNSLFMQAPVAIQILRGEDLVVEFANDLTLDIWRKGRDVIGKPLSEIMPELIGQGIIDKIKQVYYTGIPYEAYEVAIYVDKEGQRENFYFNFVYQPFYESDNKNPSGISIFASDVTDRVNAKNELKKKEQDLRESELRFRKLADESPIFVFISIGDEFASIIYWNKTWLDYTGQTMEEALGRAWSGIIHPEDIPLVYQYYNPAYNKREEYFVPAVRVKKFDGSYRWHSFKGNPRYSDGVFNGYVGVGFDIHEQKLYEKTIKRSEQDLKEKIEERTAELISQKLLLDNILANSSNGISVTEMVRDQNGNVIDAMTIIANESAVKLIGLPREIYLSKTARDVDPNILESPYGKLCLKTLKEGEPGIIQYYLEHTGKWLELTISKMDDEHLIHIFTDVTPIKESQLQVERTVEELRKSNQNLEEFAYAASHDLKEPIRKIHFFSDRIRTTMGERMNDEEKRSFERMELASKRMNSLIDDLLTYSKISIRPTTLESVDLNQLVDQVLSDLDLEIDQRSASIRIEKLCTIQGHHRQLQQAFQNLLANSLKYGRAGVKVEINIRYKEVFGKDTGLSLSTIHKEKPYHLIEIVDNGIGFDPEDSERIFNVFTRLHGNAEYKGTGVGLSIVRKVIENHNGFITAHGEPGKGSVFSIYFPVVNQ